jgi:GH43 family beta-xylosidase
VRAVAVLLLAALAACGGTDADPSPAPPSTTTTTTTLVAEPPADPAAPARIVTPGEDAPNPFVVVDGDRYLLYSTQESFFEPNVPLRTGPSLDRLGPPVDVLPTLPAWAMQGFTWAPDVRRVEDGWVLWFTAAVAEGRPDAPRYTQCIGVAVAEEAEGPFEPVGDSPAICQLDRWGSIDPRTFLDDDGQLWLHWKSDDNAEVDGTTHASIYAQRLADDGVTLLGSPTRILEADQLWEGRIVEAPHLVLVGGRYWLFYSANWFNQPVYGIGIAECEGPAGPCRKPLDHAWLNSNAQGTGPGESSMFLDDRGWWIVYGPNNVAFEEGTPRPVALAPVAFGPDGPYLARR